MGAYCYRVTAKRVLCSDGQEANLAVYAYKPYSTFFSKFGKSENARLHFRTGCATAERLAEEGRLSGRVVIADANTFEWDAENAGVFVWPHGTFIDDYVLGTEKMPVIKGVKPVSLVKPIRKRK